ncbi:MAG: glutamyl-tRNA reductase, partial [Acidimicrobiia bacterium]
ILGQVRAAREAAAAEKASGAVLERLFRHAVEVGKRVRTETAITRGTTSVSQAAVELATERLGSLDGKRVLVLGAGEMGEGMSRALASSSGIAELIVANRSHERALDLAEKVGGRAVSYTEVHDALTEVDLLLTCTGAPTMLLEESEVAHVMTQREGRRLLIVDAAVPRDVDPAVENLPGVTRLDMVDLKAFAEAGLAGRQRELVRAAEIVADEVDRYLGTAVAREVAPIVAGLRARGEELRVAELERFKSRLSSLDPAQREAVEALTKGLVNKLLHDPTVHLKQAAGSPRGDRLADALRILYDL